MHILYIHIYMTPYSKYRIDVLYDIIYIFKFKHSALLKEDSFSTPCCTCQV